MNKRIIARLLLLVLLFAVVWVVRRYQQPSIPSPNRPDKTEQHLPDKGSPSNPETQVPTYVIEVLRQVRRNGEAPDGYVGGREFQNREKKLPAKTSDGTRIRYSEWDVLPKQQGKNRGAERLVTGSDHSAWYTKDHYKHFTRID